MLQEKMFQRFPDISFVVNDDRIVLFHRYKIAMLNIHYIHRMSKRSEGIIIRRVKIDERSFFQRPRPGEPVFKFVDFLYICILFAGRFNKVQTYMS